MSDFIEILKNVWSWIEIKQNTLLAVFAFLVSLISLIVTYRTNKQTISLAKEDAENKRTRLKLEVENKLYEAFILMGRDNQMEAIQDFSDTGNLRKAQRLIEDCMILEPGKSRIYVMRGFVREGLRKYKDAFEDYKEAIRLNPKSCSAFSALALLNSEMGHAQEAEKNIGIALEISPKEPMYYFNLGNILTKSGKFEVAENAYCRAFELSDFSSPYALNYGLTLVRLGNFDKALKVFNEHEPNRNNDAKFHMAKGVLFTAVNKNESAILSFTKALNLEPNYQLAYKALGNCFMREKEYAQAISHFEKAISLNNYDAELHFSLAIAFIACDEDYKGLKHLNIAIELSPDKEEYKETLIRFEDLQKKEAKKPA